MGVGLVDGGLPYCEVHILSILSVITRYHSYVIIAAQHKFMSVYLQAMLSK